MTEIHCRYDLGLVDGVHYKILHCAKAVAISKKSRITGIGGPISTEVISLDMKVAQGTNWQITEYRC